MVGNTAKTEYMMLRTRSNIINPLDCGSADDGLPNKPEPLATNFKGYTLVRPTHKKVSYLVLFL